MCCVLFIVALELCIYESSLLQDFIFAYLSDYIESRHGDQEELTRIYTFFLEKVVENYVLMTVSVLFIHRVIKDFRSNKKHMYRLAGGMRSWEFYLGNMMVEFGLYALMMVPTTVRVLSGDLTTVTSYGILVPLDFLTKLSFGLFLFPALYLIGFSLKKYEAAAYQTVGLVFFFIGHQLSIFIVGLSCLKLTITWMTAFLPFTFSLYN
jgi:hypothetical protein